MGHICVYISMTAAYKLTCVTVKIIPSETEVNIVNCVIVKPLVSKTQNLDLEYLEDSPDYFNKHFQRPVRGNRNNLLWIQDTPRFLWFTFVPSLTGWEWEWDASRSRFNPLPRLLWRHVLFTEQLSQRPHSRTFNVNVATATRMREYPQQEEQPSSGSHGCRTEWENMSYFVAENALWDLTRFFTYSFFFGVHFKSATLSGFPPAYYKPGGPPV